MIENNKQNFPLFTKNNECENLHKYIIVTKFLRRKNVISCRSEEPYGFIKNNCDQHPLTCH